MPITKEKPDFEIRPEMGQPSPETERGEFSHAQEGEPGPKPTEQPLSVKKPEDLPITPEVPHQKSEEDHALIRSVEDINQSLSRGVSTVPTDNVDIDPRILIESLGQAIEDNQKQ